MTKPAALIQPGATLTGDRFTLVLPFPSRSVRNALSPNGRPHWRTRHAATQRMKTTAHLLTISELSLRRDHAPWKRATITYRFFWPDRNRRDLDNYMAIHKAAVDGITKAGLLVDDSWGVLSPGPAPVSELDRARPRVEIIIHREDAP